MASFARQWPIAEPTFFYQRADEGFVAVSLNSIDGWAGVILNNDGHDEQ